MGIDSSPSPPLCLVSCLQVDVEGHDFAVLTSFLNQTSTTSLPLLVAFEAKSLKELYPATVKLLNERGYVQLWQCEILT